MWCRVLLVVVAVAYVLCVLLLSGLKKEDLDVNLLKKLQRHNVNVDDLYNEKAIQKCSPSSKRSTQGVSLPAEEFVPKNTNRYKTTNLLRLRKVDYNYANNEKVVTTSKENDLIVTKIEFDSNNNRNIAEVQHNKDTQLSNIEKLINLLKTFNKTSTSNDVDVEINRKRFPAETPIILNKMVKTDSQTKDLDDISKIFETYMSAKQVLTTTLKPTTTQKFNIDIITQQIKDFLENNTIYSKSLICHTSQSPVNVSLNKRVFNYDEQSLSRKRGSSDIEDFLNLNTGVRESIKTDTQTLNTTDTVYETQTVTKGNQTSINEKVETKPFPENIILEIAEKVKASVMKDLNLRISLKTLDTTITESTKETPTPYNVQEKNQNHTSIIQNIKELFHRINKDIENTTQAASTNTFVMNTQKINETTDPLEDLMDVIKQLKHFKNSNLPTINTKYKLTRKKSTNNEFHGPINVLYPPLIPVNYAYDAYDKKQSDSLLPLYVSPYPQVLNNPVYQKPKVFKQTKIEKIKTSYEDLSDFNINQFKTIETKMEENPIIRAVPIIQTDAVEVAPLAIPVSKSVKAINQNINVTTKHPTVQYIEDRQYRSRPIGPNRYTDYGVRNHRYDTDSERHPETDVVTAYRTDVERTNDNRQAYSQREKYSEPHKHVRLNRGSTLKRNRPRAAVGNVYDEYLSEIQPTENKSYQSILWRGNNGERFHEKLERPIKSKEWPDLETVTKKDKRLKVASRQQLTMNDLKRNARYDDVHFRNFLKTQQKVDDMLEKILATKVLDKVRSVETPDTVHTIMK